jgi:CubicO group peptidase (beta-lactamase class C family)
MKPSESFPFGHPGAFGAPGAGGAMGYADPETGIGYGYVTNRMGTTLSGDLRDVALRAALPAAASRPRPLPAEPKTQTRSPTSHVSR